MIKFLITYWNAQCSQILQFDEAIAYLVIDQADLPRSCRVFLVGKTLVEEVAGAVVVPRGHRTFRLLE